MKRCNIHLNFSTRKEIYTEILVLNLEKRGRAGREILVLHLEKAYPTFSDDLISPAAASTKKMFPLEHPAATMSPFRVDKHDPEVMSHVLMVLSLEPLTTILGLSGLKATQVT